MIQVWILPRYISFIFFYLFYIWHIKVIWNQENDSVLGSSSTQQLWTDKYKLCSLEEPDVQKKNVEHFLTPSRFEGLVNPKRDLALGSSSRQQLWTNKNKPCSLEEHAIQKENVGRFLTPSRFEGLVNPDHDSASASSSTQQLWAEKYKPRSLEELAVQRKKVDFFFNSPKIRRFSQFIFISFSSLYCLWLSSHLSSFLLQVEEVRAWFEERLGDSKVVYCYELLLLHSSALSS